MSEREFLSSLVLELNQLVVQRLVQNKTIPMEKKQEWFLSMAENLHNFTDILLGKDDEVVEITVKRETPLVKLE